ncbi:U-box domain-containing protein 17 [Striga hermonthica]|uniref:RING-type E3 ubiquitin transferase n=1 Tax=Striga hermonthica TaxID=68872 RepID=A0A9N7NMW4_STRHE|nr:U-box domain-containing protein 17 [Striga hermonthica]
MRRRSSPTLEAFLAPVNVSDSEILEALRAVAAELVSSFSGDSKTTPFFQVKNSRSLIRKIQVISILLDASLDLGLSEKAPAPAPAPAVFLCFKELYLHLYRCKILIDFVKGSSKLWLLLQNHSISGHFHDLNQEISTLLDVFPLGELNLPEEVKEQVELLGKQSRNSKLFVDSHDELLRFKLYHFLSELENGEIPEKSALRDFFVEKLSIRNVESCLFEIEFLEEQIANHDGDIEPTTSILNGFVALIRYCRFLLFRFEDELDLERYSHKKFQKGMLTQEELADIFLTIPNDFVCPVSWDLMRDPVLISTGHTYERSSISRWMQERHCTCPKTGQILLHTKIIPNRALRNLIAHWCAANRIPYEPPENSDYFPENNNYSAGLPTKAQVEATKATASLLVEQLANGLPRAQSLAAMEIRFLAKTGKQNRACIAEAGAIPLLETLLSSNDPSTQENSITAILNLSILDTNKSVIMGSDGCLCSIISVLINGLTVEARENAAAVLFSLSSVHEFKKVIARREEAVRALARMLVAGTPRGRRDAATAIFNLSTDGESCGLLVGFGAVRELVRGLAVEEAAEAAAGALALIVRRRLPEAAVAVEEEEETVERLVEMMKWGTPKGKENAVTALLEICRGGGGGGDWRPEVVERVGRVPEMVGLLQSLMVTGTKRARRKAATLTKVFEKWGDRIWLGAAGYGGESEERYSSSVVMISMPVL